MILFLAMIICVAGGGLRFSDAQKKVNKIYNGRQLLDNDLHLPSRTLPLLVSCGSSCLSATRCSSLEITRTTSRFEIFTDTCTGGTRRICYRRVISKPSMNEIRTVAHANTPNDYTPKPPPGRERLLIMSSCQKIPPKMYNLQTRSIEDYHDPGLVNVKCMVFMPLTQRLLLGLVKPSVVQIYSKDGRKTICRFFASMMALDEQRELVFLIKYRSHNIYRTQLKSFKNFICIYKLKRSRVKDMVADMNAKELYVACWKGLVGLTYNGTLIGTLDRSQNIYCLALDLEQGILYYSLAFKLKRVILSEKKTELVLNHRYLPSQMIYFNGSVFFSFVGKDRIVIVSISKAKTLSVFDNIYGDSYRGIKFLLIALVTI